MRPCAPLHLRAARLLARLLRCFGLAPALWLLSAPFVVFVSWLALCNACTAGALSLLGRPCSAVAKAADLEALVQKVAQQEGKARSQVQELQHKLEAANSSIKQLQQKYRAVKRRAAQLETELQQAEPPPSDGERRAPGSGAQQGAAQPGNWRVHGAAAAAAAVVHWYCRIEEDPLQQKLMMALVWPVVWLYVAMLLTGAAAGPRLQQGVLAACCALLGYVGHEAVHVLLGHRQRCGRAGSVYEEASWR